MNKNKAEFESLKCRIHLRVGVGKILRSPTGITVQGEYFVAKTPYGKVRRKYK